VEQDYGKLSNFTKFGYGAQMLSLHIATKLQCTGVKIGSAGPQEN